MPNDSLPIKLLIINTELDFSVNYLVLINWPTEAADL